MSDAGSELTAGLILSCGFPIAHTCSLITNARSFKKDRKNIRVELK